MKKLNCEIGDLAITVNCKVPENLGSIVRVKSAIGIKQWGASEEALFSWDVEIATERGWLVYEYGGYPETAKSGPVPDQYLRRISPPKGYLLEEFSDSEELQINFHEVEIFESETNV